MKLWLKTTEGEEGNRYPDTGSTESPKQDEPKQSHTPKHFILKMTKLKVKTEF